MDILLLGSQTANIQFHIESKHYVLVMAQPSDAMCPDNFHPQELAPQQPGESKRTLGKETKDGDLRGQSPMTTMNRSEHTDATNDNSSLLESGGVTSLSQRTEEKVVSKLTDVSTRSPRGLVRSQSTHTTLGDDSISHGQLEGMQSNST